MKTKKTIIVDSDIDFQIIERKITQGQLTKKQWKKIYGFLRKKLNWQTNCGCVYDCCGHAFKGRLISISRPYKNSGLIIRSSIHFNY